MKSKTSAILYPLSFFILLMIGWQYISSRELMSFWIFPSPKAVFMVFWEHYDLLWYHLKFTLYATLSGLLISIVFGIILAILMDISTGFKKTIYPYIVVTQTVPIIAVAPLLIIWFGYGISAKIFTVILICSFPIAMNLFDGLRQVSIDHIRLMQSMGAGKWKIFRYLKLPSALPNLFTGLKLAATYSVMGAIIGEWLGGYGGLGIYMTRATKSYQTDSVFAIIVLIVMLSMLIFGLVSLLERIYLRRYKQQAMEYQEVQKKRGAHRTPHQT